MAELRLERLCKSFTANLHALEDVSLTVAPGECLAIVGPSGCGKTTLLRVIAGLETLTTGAVHSNGQRVDHRPCHERDVAMLFQRPALMPSQTVRQNLGWAWTLRRETWREDELLRLARALGLDADLDRPVQQLSGGQQQRVALGRCLLRKTTIWLLDEPFGNLDAPLRTAVRRVVRELARLQGATVLLVTHDPAEAFATGDRVAVMHAGRIVQVDGPAELLRHPVHRFVAELAHHDRGGLNCIAGQLNEKGFASSFGLWSVPKVQSASTDFSANPARLVSKEQAIHIIMGIAGDNVHCSCEMARDEERIQVTIPVVQQEVHASGTWVIGQDARGRLVGRASGEQRFDVGQSVTMTFSLQDCYGFDGVTGTTVWTPG